MIHMNEQPLGNSLPENGVLVVLDPTGEDISRLVEGYEIDKKFLAADLTKASGMIIRDDRNTLYCRFQVFDKLNELDYDLRTLEMVYHKDVILLIMESPVPYLKKIAEGIHPEMSPTAILSLIIDIYLEEIRFLEVATDALTLDAQKRPGNDDLRKAFRISRSLVHLSGGLDTLERILEDGERLDYFPENMELFRARHQLKYTTKELERYTNVLAQAIDLLEGLINNRMNDIVEFLTVITIAVNAPTIIAGLWGMNVSLPMEHSPVAFPTLVIASVVLTVLTIFLLQKRR